jgi:hypothetical protein
MDPLGQVLCFLDLSAILLLLLRLAWLKLYRGYRLLFVYFAVMAVEIALAAWIPQKTNLYAEFYFGAQSVLIVLAVCIVQDLYKQALELHPALATFSRRSVLAVAAFAAVVAAFGAALDRQVLPGQYANVHRFLAIERTLDLMILIFLLLISGFILWFPVKVRRNIVVYIGGFVVFHLSRTVGLLLTNLLPQRNLIPLSNAMQVVFLFCALFWSLGLRTEDLDSRTVAGHRWDPEAMKKLSGQLDAINSALSRFVRS